MYQPMKLHMCDFYEKPKINGKNFLKTSKLVQAFL